MGYSIMVECKYKKDKKKMLSFMENNYIQPPEFFKDEPFRARASRGVTDDLSYGPTPYSIGFDYSCLNEPERSYVYTILRWMATKVGKTKKFEGMETPLHFISYDGDEDLPFVIGDVKDLPEDTGWAICEDCCWSKGYDESVKNPAWLELLGIKGPRNWKRQIKTEIARLDKLWEENQKSS
jgi:hypothetical protein